jgi:hypothetical protein
MEAGKSHIYKWFAGSLWNGPEWWMVDLCSTKTFVKQGRPSGGLFRCSSLPHM